MDANLGDLLDGKALEEAAEFCDYSLEDQVEELALKGIESNLRDYTPICKKSVCYIVAAVLINDQDEVLMMQEAKSECAGTWYLPAGRMEHGENILEAVHREVLEETGLTFDPVTLVMIENAQGNWYRFVFTGNITGGALKTVAQADAESLQASWIDDINQLNLRSEDIIPLIERTRNYWQEANIYHKPLLPSIRPHEKLLLRTVVVVRKKESNRLHVLVSERKAVHLPVCEINPTRSIHAALKRFMQTIFNQLPPHKPHGIVSVEYSGQSPGEKDGICLTVLISCRVPLEQAVPSSGYSWLAVAPELEQRLLQGLNKNMTVTLNVIR